MTRNGEASAGLQVYITPDEIVCISFTSHLSHVIPLPLPLLQTSLLIHPFS
jgi:hypothetical protein